MGSIWAEFVEEHPCEKGESDVEYLERFFRYLTEELGFHQDEEEPGRIGRDVP